MNWDMHIESFKNYLNLELGLSKQTQKAYLSDIRLFAQTFPNSSPKKISKEHILEYLYEIAKVLDPKSQARKLAAIKQFFNYMVLRNYVEIHPAEAIESPKYSRKIPDTLSIDEIDSLIEHIDFSKAQAYRNQAIIECLYACGLRVSELVNLRYSDIHNTEEIIQIHGKGNKDRFVPIAPYTLECIAKYEEFERHKITIQKEYEDYVFLNRRGAKLTRVMIFTIVKDLAMRANLKKNISPHTFRHSFASHLLESGADLMSIKQMLGHESITTTEVYLHIDKSKVKEILNTYHPRAKN